MKFILWIESDNAAMVDTPHAEIARILEETARYVYEGTTYGSVRDSNGNKVGSYTLTLIGDLDAYALPIKIK